MEATKKCMRCGAPMAQGSLFCTQCGQMQNEQAGKTENAAAYESVPNGGIKQADDTINTLGPSPFSDLTGSVVPTVSPFKKRKSKRPLLIVLAVLAALILLGVLFLWLIGSKEDLSAAEIEPSPDAIPIVSVEASDPIVDDGFGRTFGPENAIDCDRNTCWMTGDPTQGETYIRFNFGSVQRVAELRFLNGDTWDGTGKGKTLQDDPYHANGRVQTFSVIFNGGSVALPFTAKDVREESYGENVFRLPAVIETDFIVLLIHEAYPGNNGTVTVGISEFEAIAAPEENTTVQQPPTAPYVPESTTVPTTKADTPAGNKRVEFDPQSMTVSQGQTQTMTARFYGYDSVSLRQSDMGFNMHATDVKDGDCKIFTIEITGNIVGNWNLDFVAQKDGAEEVFHYPITVV